MTEPSEIDAVLAMATRAADDMSLEGRHQWAGIVLMLRQTVAVMRFKYESPPPETPPETP